MGHPSNPKSAHNRLRSELQCGNGSDVLRGTPRLTYLTPLALPWGRMARWLPPNFQAAHLGCFLQDRTLFPLRNLGMDVTPTRLRDCGHRGDFQLILQSQPRNLKDDKPLCSQGSRSGSFFICPILNHPCSPARTQPKNVTSKGDNNE